VRGGFFMTLNPSSSPGSDYPPPNQDRQRFRRWWVVGGLVVALLLVGAAAAYAGTVLANRGESAAEDLAAPSATLSSAPPSLPPGMLPTERPTDLGWAFCRDVNFILSDEFVELDVDYVKSRRAAADRLRELEAPTLTHQAALDELADQLDAAAQMVEDDPAAEGGAIEREDAAYVAFVNAGGCDPAWR
jgi:hypothetical protein